MCRRLTVWQYPHELKPSDRGLTTQYRPTRCADTVPPCHPKVIHSLSSLNPKLTTQAHSPRRSLNQLQIADMVSSPKEAYGLRLQRCHQLTRPSKGIELQAYVIGALCASGGTYGYIKTGSIPSVTAGVTVGVLVSSC
jgi:hypothetical protein